MNNNVFDNIENIISIQYEMQYLDEVTKEPSFYYKNYGFCLYHVTQVKEILKKINDGKYEYAEISDTFKIIFDDLTYKRYNLKIKDHVNELNKIIDLLIEHIMLLMS